MTQVACRAPSTCRPVRAKWACGTPPTFHVRVSQGFWAPDPVAGSFLVGELHDAARLGLWGELVVEVLVRICPCARTR